MPSKKKNKNKPKDGWVQELREAEAQAKADTSTSAEPHLRVARAARKLRLWKKCQSAAATGVSIAPESPLRAQLIECQKQAVEELSIGSAIDRQYEEIRKKIIRKAQNVDKTLSSSPTFNNLNMLQAAVLQGDVRIFEDVVSLGAAIDHPVLAGSINDLNSGESMNDLNPHDSITPAPQGTTALVMCCANLALYGKVGDTQDLPDDLTRMLDGILECAILLVQLGADCQKKLNIPSNDRRPGPLSVYRQIGLDGKTAQQMAQLSKKEDLIKVMAEFENKEKKIAMTICRCGSRLPWRECHVGKRIGESPIFMEDKGKMVWRYSPLAPCYCDQQPVKIHFKCCWIQTTSPHYQDDDTGALNGTMAISEANMPPGAFDQMARMLKLRELESGGDPNALLFVERDAYGVPTGREIDPQTMRDQQAAAIRSGGSSFLKQMCSKFGGVRDRVADMDPDVYAGCMERIDNEFLWSDTHWCLDRVELLNRVKEWNEALNKFCDDRGLTGSERLSAIEMHQATPYAPCGNPSCSKVETKVKEYLKCSRCKTIAFCSRECQREAWKIHKKACMPA